MVPGIVLSLVVALLPPQTAEDILRVTAKAHGWLANLPDDKVMVTTGTRAETFQGKAMSVDYTEVRKGEDLSHEEERITIAGQVYRRETRYDGQAGWVKVSDGRDEKSRDMTASKIQEYKDRKAIQSLACADLVLQNRKAKLERLKDEMIGGSPAYAVRASQEGGTTRCVIFVDQKSLYVVRLRIARTESDGKEHVYEQSYSDFQRTDGGVFGRKMESRMDGNLELTETIESMNLKPSKDYPDSMFRKPKP